MPIQLSKGLSPDETIERSYKEALAASEEDKGRFVFETLGGGTPGDGGFNQELFAWTTQGLNRPVKDSADRLRILFLITYAVASGFDASTAAAFVREQNPRL